MEKSIWKNIIQIYTTVQKFGVSTILDLWIKINTYILQRCNKWIKKDSKDIYNVRTYLFFVLDNNKECFLMQQIGILELYLKDHVTLKTGVIMLKIQFCSHRNKLHFKIEKLFLNCNKMS